METLFDPKLFRAGTKVSLPERKSGDGLVWPAVESVVTADAWRHQSGGWVCRIAHHGIACVRVEALTLLKD